MHNSQDTSSRDVEHNPLIDKVKKQLTEQASKIKGADIFVSSPQNGEIILKGVVDSSKERDEAVAIAKQVEGVKKVSEEFRIMSEKNFKTYTDTPMPGLDSSKDDQGCSPSPRVG